MPSREIVPGLVDSLKAAREKSGLSQYQAADAAGVHQVSIAKYETGKATPTLPILYKLADAYGVAVCDLLPEGDRPPAAAKSKKTPGKK
ncbi:MAG: helix-turn-helix transcriptional regulator [Gemmataceae bacterium]